MHTLATLTGLGALKTQRRTWAGAWRCGVMIQLFRITEWKSLEHFIFQKYWRSKDKREKNRVHAIFPKSSNKKNQTSSQLPLSMIWCHKVFLWAQLCDLFIICECKPQDITGKVTKINYKTQETEGKKNEVKKKNWNKTKSKNLQHQHLLKYSTKLSMGHRGGRRLGAHRREAEMLVE